MSKKELAIATIHPRTGVFLSEEIKKLFKDTIEIKRYSFEDRSIEQGIECNLIIILEEAIFEALKKYVKDNVEIIIAKRTITKEGFQKIINIEDGKKAALVNVDSEMAMESISLIYQLGAKNIELTPVYPGISKIPDFNLAITPGEIEFVPDSIENIIDIGDRVLDISTIFDLAVKLGLENILEGEEAKAFFDRIMPVSFGLEQIMGKKNRLECKLDILLESLDEAIIGINSLGVINSYNRSAEKILGYKRKNILGEDYKGVFDQIPFDEVLKCSQPVENEIIKINDTSIITTINPIIKHETLYGAVAIVKNLNETVKEQNKLREKLIGKGHIARYNFNDILGKSVKIEKAKKIASRMADSNSTVLITGETGAGKELFAQAIHNQSRRKKHQFVAINCAAFPEGLLESELFGYEKGAFTGAKKEGKMGLFELADRGTLFLDEISEMPLKLQSRLLRVLELRKVMRVGGDTVISVDVRIIASTNKELKKMVKKGKFREDLYYRLSVLPLKIPPLRERKGDIMILIENIKEELKADFQLSSQVVDLFLEHRWDGNVRELRNYIEFFANLKKSIIKISDLPFTFNEDKNLYIHLNDEDKVILNSLYNNIPPNKLKNFIFVLDELEIRFKSKQPTGRRSIADAAQRQNIYLSEQEIRKIYKEMEDYNLVNIKKGRGGTRLTRSGQNILKSLKDDIVN